MNTERSGPGLHALKKEHPLSAQRLYCHNEPTIQSVLSLDIALIFYVAIQWFHVSKAVKMWSPGFHSFMFKPSDSDSDTDRDSEYLCQKTELIF